MKAQELFDLINELVFWDAERFKDGYAEMKAMEYIKEFKDEVCESQRDICAEACEDKFYYGQILNAPQP